MLAALAEQRDVHLWLPHPSPVLWERLAGLAGTVPRAGQRPTPRRRPVRTAGRQPAARQPRPGRPRAAAPAARALDRRPTTTIPRAPTGDAARRRCRGAPRRPAGAAHPPTSARRPQPAGARLPRRRPPGRGPARGPRRAARRRPHARASRRARDVPRHRGLRAAHLGDVRPRRRGRRGRRPPRHRLRVRLADRSLRQTNPLLGTLADVLDLAGGAGHRERRCSTSPARRRYGGGSGFADDDLDRLRGVGRARRGAVGARRRAPGAVRARSRSSRTPGGRGSTGSCSARRWPRTTCAGSALALPLDDVDSSDIDLAGRLAELVDRLGAVLDALAGEQPARRLARRARATRSTCSPTSRQTDAWQSAQAAPGARRRRPRRRRQAGEPPLSLRRRTRPARRPPRGPAHPGQLPHRQPHGVLDGADAVGAAPGGLPARPRRRRLPAQGSVDGDDVLARDPCVGERDPRSEDRQLLLDAIMAARRAPGRPLHAAPTRARTRPAARGPGRRARSTLVGRWPDRRRQPGRAGALVTRHPLQPFDPRNFVPGALGTGGPFSFDVRPRSAAPSGAARAATAGGRARCRAAARRPDDAEVELLDAGRASSSTRCRGFLRQRLGVDLARDEEAELDDALCIEPVGPRPVGGRRPAAACAAGRRRRVDALPAGGVAARHAAARALGRASSTRSWPRSSRSWWPRRTCARPPAGQWTSPSTCPTRERRGSDG